MQVEVTVVPVALTDEARVCGVLLIVTLLSHGPFL